MRHQGCKLASICLVRLLSARQHLLLVATHVANRVNSRYDVLDHELTRMVEALNVWNIDRRLVGEMPPKVRIFVNTAVGKLAKHVLRNAGCLIEIVVVSWQVLARCSWSGRLLQLDRHIEDI